MREVVYNTCYGGFGISDEAARLYIKLKTGKEPKKEEKKYSWSCPYYIDKPGDFYDDVLDRHDPILVLVVKILKEKANGTFSSLDIATVQGPYRIDEYDGLETVVEPEDYRWIY